MQLVVILMDKPYKYMLAFQYQNLKHKFPCCCQCVVKVVWLHALVDGYNIMRSLKYLNAHSSVNK